MNPAVELVIVYAENKNPYIALATERTSVFTLLPL